MASLTIVRVASFLLLLAISSFFQLHNLVIADEKLIQIECHNAEVPTSCIECLKSDPHAEKTDKVGIASIIIDCLSNHAKTLATNMSDIVPRIKDQNEMEVFKACSKGYSTAAKKLFSATLNLKNGKYNDAEQLVALALNYDLYCYVKIKQTYKGRFPSSIAYEMRIYEELSEAACRIIEGL